MPQDLIMTGNPGESENTPEKPIDNRIHYVHTAAGILSFTARDKQLIDTFIQTADIEAAALRSGVTLEYANLFLRGPNMEAYLKETVENIARKNSTTLEAVVARLNKVAFGELEISKLELKALEMLGRLLQFIKPAETKIAVVQNNTTVTSPITQEDTHPFKDMTDEQLDAMLADRIQEAEIAHVQESEPQRQAGAA